MDLTTPAKRPHLIACDPPESLAVPPPGVVGSKAHHLARMVQLGLAVPPAFVLGTAWCGTASSLVLADLKPGLDALERVSGLTFGDLRRPLLVSVRSGAPVSMPGMMETLLNIGLCDATVPGLLRLTGNPRMVWDAYRRLVCAYGEIVLGIDPALFDADRARLCAARDERDLDYAELRTLVRAHLQTVLAAARRPFPQDPNEQLLGAVVAVFRSWQAPKAVEYRRLKGIDASMGTAVTVQKMAFGNSGGTSGAGVGFSRHPSTGAPEPWVDFLTNAQGEDVVSGRRSIGGQPSLQSLLPAVWEELVGAAKLLERALGDMQDFEFTVENGRLLWLQTRSGKRTVQAGVRIALDLMDEGVIDAAEALRRTQGITVDDLSVERVGDEDAPELATCATAAHGVVAGEIALDEDRARSRAEAGVPVILVRQEADTRDIAALDVAAGLLTARGARTSHAAVVARQLGKVCLVGCDQLSIDRQRRSIRIGVRELPEGSFITLDGNEGRVFEGRVGTRRHVPHELAGRLESLRRMH